MSPWQLQSRVVPLSGSKVKPWLNVNEFKKYLEGVGIDTSTKLVALVLRDLEHGTEIGATGRARLPTNEKNAW